MRTSGILAALFIMFLQTGCPPERADLVVYSFGITGERTVNEHDEVICPIGVVVQNQGLAEAGVFKLSVDFTDAQDTYDCAFTVPGQSDTWYPYSTDSLAPEEAVTFEGYLTIPRRKQDVTLVVRVDSTSGDEFIPSWGRVNETNELNNDSLPIVVALP